MIRRTWATAGLLAVVVAGWMSRPGTPGSSAHQEHATPRITLDRSQDGAPAARDHAEPAPSVAIHVAERIPTPSAALYRSNELIVRVSDPTQLSGVLCDHGVQLQRHDARSGLALVTGAVGDLASLRDDPRVSTTAANGIVSGAGTGSLEHLQWHLEQVEPPEELPGADRWVVAVLDTGVAYETAHRDGVDYAQAPSLAASPIVAPYDFVNDDPWSNDDHQHGTHIASLIASSGSVVGTAPGASLMPLKVLDQQNTGTEFALIQALWHAVDHGADVINMSLSFGQGYQPSLALRQALQAAYDAGVVMVAASGNDGTTTVSWPAASPHVLAIGASRSDSPVDRPNDVANYSNIGGAIDALLPGGDITADLDGNGLVDGILAESIRPGAPSDVGYWLMAGTSQAAAIATGLVVHLLDDGIEPREIYVLVQDWGNNGRYDAGVGGGFLTLEGRDKLTTKRTSRDTYVSMYPYLRDLGSQVQPVVRMVAFNPDGSPGMGLRLHATIWGNDDGILRCRVDSEGMCEVEGAPVDRNDAYGQPIPHVWTSAVEVVESHVGHRPRVAMTATDALQDVVAAMQADVSLRDALLAWSWTRTTDAEHGPVDAAYSVTNSGSGFASIPLGLLMTPSALRGLGTLTATTVVAGGTPVQLGVLDLDGSGLASIPLGLTRLKLVTIDGTGFASIPLGLRAFDAHGGGRHLFPLDGTGFASIPLGLRASPLGVRLAQGGWQTQGYDAVSALAGSSELAVSPEYAVNLEGELLSGTGVGTAVLP